MGHGTSEHLSSPLAENHGAVAFLDVPLGSRGATQPGCTARRFSRLLPYGPWEHIRRVPGLFRSQNPIRLDRRQFVRLI